MTVQATTIIAGLGVLIASFGGLIAYFQWRTAHQRVVLDLFDRRLAVFREIEDALKAAINDLERQKLEPAFWAYVRAEANARFLFGSEISKALASLRMNFSEILAFTDIKPEHPEFEKLVDRKYNAIQAVLAFVSGEAGELFSPYLRLDQRMPSVWWPRRPA